MQADVKCEVFEDNSGALEILRTDECHPRIKHLYCRLHHFRSYVDAEKITIHKVQTTYQDTNMMTKPLYLELLKRCRFKIMEW